MACDSSDASTSQESLKITRKHQELDKARQIFPLELSEKSWPYQDLKFQFLTSKKMRY